MPTRHPTAHVVFLVLAAAGPLIGLTGAAPTAMVVGDGPGAYVAYLGRRSDPGASRARPLLNPFDRQGNHHVS
jgi:hypothetical protein